MGLLSDILLAPVTGPAHLFVSLLETIRDQANAQMPSQEKLKDELVRLNARLELGEIDEAEFQKQEEELLAELKQMREDEQAAAAAEAQAAADEESQ
ncbi:MAG: gas vesicle protein GvpG [Polyangiaceae bacterium]|nr:gas vesicle protein GvpG [Polyangiaceae bacterium]